MNTTDMPSRPNGTNQSDTVSEYTIKRSIKIAELVINPIVLIIVLFGDILLIAAIVRMKRAWVQINMLIINLAICDMIIVFFSILFGLLRLLDTSTYLFGPIGCKLLSPVTTYANTAGIFTLVLIAIERYSEISHRCKLSQNCIACMIFALHLVAICAIIPYSKTLKYELYYGKSYCYEEWNDTSKKAYTIVLFFLQYGFPLPIMIALYSISWIKIRNHNKTIIDMSEDFENKIEWDNQRHVSATFEPVKQTSLLDLTAEQDLSRYSPRTKNMYLSPTGPVFKPNSTPNIYAETMHHDISKRSLPVATRSLPVAPFDNNYNYNSGQTMTRSSTMEKLKNFRDRISSSYRTPEFKSQVSQVRHRQTMRTLHMFITVVTVFEIFAIPNQIYWFIRDFGGQEPPVELSFSLALITNFSYMANCWIYGGFSKKFRRAYKEIFITIFKCSTKRAMLSRGSTAQHLMPHDEVQDERLKYRQIAFTDMFEQHTNNHENFQHLYKERCETSDTNVALEMSKIEDENQISGSNA